MAVVSVKKDTALQVKYVDGVDAKGLPLTKSQKFSNLKLTATDQAIVNTGKALEPVLVSAITEIAKIDTFVLTDN